MSGWVVALTAIGYLGLLFLLALFLESRKKKLGTLTNNPYVYALSLAIYCTAWTYYGSVGNATENGILFLAIYIGPTIACFFMLPVLSKIIRIAKHQRISSIADFISARYGKNTSIGILVTLLCIIGVIPYISLQIKAITTSFDLISATNPGHNPAFYGDSGFYISILLAVFIILFGTRNSDASENNRGLIGVIAFESIVKLIGLTVAGLFVTYGLYNGFGDLFEKASKSKQLEELFSFQPEDHVSWFFMLIASMFAFFFLPRQFQVSVIENQNEKHLRKAVWLLPLYLLIINIFILPIAFGGELLPGNQLHNPDTYTLSIPLASGHSWLGLFVFIGGFSAATGMIIVETIAISNMVSNNIIIPAIIRIPQLKQKIDTTFSRNIIWIRRITIIFILAMAYLYEKNIAQFISLVSIGLVSFAAVSQFAPALLAGIYWKGATKTGAVIGIVLGFTIWFYTLVVPSLVDSGLINQSLLDHGPFGISWLKPTGLFGLEDFDSLSHSLFWSLFFNISGLFIGSIYSKQSKQEIYQAALFVNIHKHSANDDESLWKRTASIPDLNSLLENFLGKERSTNLIRAFANRHKIDFDERSNLADPRLIDFSERILSGVIGTASASIMVASVTKEEDVSIDEVMKILQESQQTRELNKELRKKSLELQRATDDLTKANQRLKDIDSLKDEFLYTVTHELRTPLTAIRAMAEILNDNPDMEEGTRSDFLDRIVREIERLSHLITQVLYLERYESGRQKLKLTSFSAIELASDVKRSLEPIYSRKNIRVKFTYPNSSLLLFADRDLLQQALANLLSNAIKFSEENSEIEFLLYEENDAVHFIVKDTGKGIPKDEIPFLFDKFFQARNQTLKKPEGSGLGLAITKRIVEMHGGSIQVRSQEGKGSRFSIIIPNFVPEKTP